LPDAPGWLAEYAHKVTDAWTTPYQKLQALEKNLWESNYSLQARPGESYGAVYRVLLGKEGEKVGYDEQYASAFAMLARSLQFPTRVAVGYRLDETKRNGDVYTVTTADAHAWPEVELAGYGWVPFEPANPSNSSDTPPPISDVVPPLANEPTPPDVAQPDPSSDTGATETTPLLAKVSLIGLFVVLGLILLVLLIVGAIVLAKLIRRRRRRNSGTPARRIAAAWQEVIDRLREAGQPVVPSQTPSEVARAVDSRKDAGWSAVATSLTELSVIVTSAVCAPTAPTSVAARRAWELQDSIAAALTARRSTLARIRALLDLRPLLPGASRLARSTPAKVPNLPVPVSRSGRPVG
jgi:hypothetical protein